MRTRWGSLAALAAVVLTATTAARADDPFDYAEVLFDPPSTLFVNVESVDTGTGVVHASGADSQCPGTPFTWDWGDGTDPESGWFPSQHTYTNLSQNYIITVTAHYSGGGTDTTQQLVRFQAPSITPVALPADLAVTIPDSDVTLDSRMPGYTPPATLTHFDDSHFTVTPRSSIEYVLTAAASIQNDLVNGNVPDVGGGFQQRLLRDTNLAGGGMYTLWYTDPVSFAASADAPSGTIPWSSFFHEMGHNVTLNFPADYYYGGKIDGNANAIYSETMAQIFQHATAYELVNDADAYGLESDLAFEIATSATASMRIVRQAYDRYVDNGAVFCSWNDPGTGQDETFDTFMTIAYRFCVHAENGGQGYGAPLERTMGLLQLFDEDLRDLYDQHVDNLDADTFRSTLMVSALSYGFDTDLRQEFEDLNFPIDDAMYGDLIAAAPEPATVALLGLGLVGLIARKRHRK